MLGVLRATLLSKSATHASLALAWVPGLAAPRLPLRKLRTRLSALLSALLLPTLGVHVVSNSTGPWMQGWIALVFEGVLGGHAVRHSLNKCRAARGYYLGNGPPHLFFICGVVLFDGQQKMLTVSNRL